jgi:hypothetical protein
VPDLDVVFVGELDRFGPIGIKGLGETGIVGVSAAITNAVYHASERIRVLPTPSTSCGLWSRSRSSLLGGGPGRGGEVVGASFAAATPAS